MAIILRRDKGSALTNNQVDDNFAFLDSKIDALQQWVAANFVVALYASMDDPDTGIGSIGADWETITTYESNAVPPRGIATDLAAGTMVFTFPGIYELGIYLNMQGHNSSNSGRTSQMRLFNLDDNMPGDGLAYGIGRNQEDTLVSANALFEIDETEINKRYALQIGGGDSVTSIDKMVVGFEAQNVGEWRGTVTPVTP